MRQRSLVSTTMREVPSEAEVTSHRLMLKAGFIRQLAAGIYSYLPLGLKVLHKVERIIRQEMERVDAQEVLMPAMQPAEIWKESGRYSVYGPEMIRFKDRHGREFALGPTHEEVITTLVKNEITSYRRLPVNLFQIQTKYRDERRPRFGLIRGREFIMKDGYSFDADWQGLDKTYNQMFHAYNRIFERCGLKFRAVEADAGAIGGEGGTHEFMALAEIGEDIVVSCPICDYAANLEKAESWFPDTEKQISDKEVEKFHTPGLCSVEQLVEVLNVDAKDIIKTLVYVADGKPIAVVVRGDHEVNEVKLKNYLGAEDIAIADAATIEAVTEAKAGYIGPIGLSIPLLLDRAVLQIQHGIAGANEENYHYRNVQPIRDLKPTHIGDFRNVVEGELCPRCLKGELKFNRGIEVGHIFKLGTKYSEKLGAIYLNEAGQTQPMVMGCYGIGVSRILSAVVEQNHDEDGIIWPETIAPFYVHIIPVSIKDGVQADLAEKLYKELTSQGIEVLFDDRDERLGVKLKDSDLIGIPYRIIVGRDAEHGKVEFVERRNTKDKQIVSTEEIVNLLENKHKNAFIWHS